MKLTTVERSQGVMLGVAVGDLLGSPIEGFDISQDPAKQPGFEGYQSIAPDDPDNGWKRRAGDMAAFAYRNEEGMIRRYIGHLSLGYWEYGETTDDTAQTALVAESLIEHDGFQPEDVAQRLVQWYDGGRGKGCGGTTGLALQLLDPDEVAEPLAWHEAGFKARQMTEAAPVMYKARSHKRAFPITASPSNGALMRTAPIGVYYHLDQEARQQAAHDLCIITHGFEEAIAVSQLQTDLVAELVNGNEKQAALAIVHDRYPDIFEQSLETAVSPIEGVSYTGGAMTSLGIMLDSFISTTSFEDAVVSAVSSSSLRAPWLTDVDTYGAITGAVAGAYYGAAAIPTQWYTLEHPETGLTHDLSPYPARRLLELGRLLVVNG